MVEDFVKVTIRLEISDTLAENLNIPVEELQKKVMKRTVEERTILLRKVLTIIEELLKT